MRSAPTRPYPRNTALPFLVLLSSAAAFAPGPLPSPSCFTSRIPLLAAHRSTGAVPALLLRPPTLMLRGHIGHKPRRRSSDVVVCSTGDERAAGEGSGGEVQVGGYVRVRGDARERMAVGWQVGLPLRHLTPDPQPPPPAKPHP